jgi:two-component system cell cycle response regulator
LEHSFPILIAEDSLVSRKLLEKTLVRAGYRVTSVENGKRAVELLKKQFFPIVLTDWMMPEMDGLELCRAIREDTDNGYVFIILLTAKDSKDDLVTGLGAGADDYLTKPVDHLELMARLKTAKRILELERSLKRANEEIKALSETDPLTGSYNRGYLNEHLPVEIKRARRYGRALSLCLCDIDHFKRVNDTYGHQAGDLVLKSFARMIRSSIRKDLDWVVRYGGEEFLIVLPETDLMGACVVAERIRKRVSESGLPAGERMVSITASFGVSGLDETAPDEQVSGEEIIRRADEHLYRAKEGGRNRVQAGPSMQVSSNVQCSAVTLSPPL